MTVVGISRVDISNKDMDIHGYKYYLTEKRDKVVGVATDSFFASDRVLNTLPRDIGLDDEILPIYPRESRSLKTVIFLND